MKLITCSLNILVGLVIWYIGLRVIHSLLIRRVDKFNYSDLFQFFGGIWTVALSTVITLLCCA